MTSELAVLRRSFGPDDLKPLLARHRIDRSVLVQTISSVDETRWFLELAEKHPFIGGVVGWADLTQASLGETLDDLQRNPKLVGLRHQVQDEPDTGWLSWPAVRRGFVELARRSLAYDLLIRPAHLGASLRLAQQFPELKLVIDHLAKPAIARGEWDGWGKGIKALGQCSNVCCKLSGIITEASWSAWKPADLKPYIDHVLEAFGTDRVMFGSDWPVCLLAGSYQEVIEALETNLTDLSRSEREKVFGLNAARFYGLTRKI